MKPTYALVVDYRLRVPPFWRELTAEEIGNVSNGVGPASWAAWKRDAVGKVLPWMVPASIPHDVWYWWIGWALATNRISDAEAHTYRLQADRELLINWKHTLRVNLHWRWYDWLAYPPSVKRSEYVASCWIATAAYEAVRIAGHDAVRDTDPERARQ